MTSPDQGAIKIVPYSPKYRQIFYDMNIEWLEKYFTVEPVHRKVLADPEGNIIAGGGEIFFALLDNKVIGTVAVKIEGNDSFELTKLAVSSDAQGKGVGQKLCERVIAFFKEKQGTLLFLETHTKLKPAMRIYEKLGFKIANNPKQGIYAGTDCYMVWHPSTVEHAS